jgi:putative Mg2+ transporter-C (MgtC) family protein
MIGSSAAQRGNECQRQTIIASEMPIEIHWPDIALRLALTVAAGVLLGAERSKTGHAAGLRTTLLVTLAASVAMIQMNLLLPTNGKPHDSYAVMDLMRLPLGILTGVGFIGAGAIVRKNELILGVTTAATMWFATVVGLCMGGGQLVLGSVSAVIGFLVLWGFRYIEHRVERYQIAELRIRVQSDQLLADELLNRLIGAHFRVKSLSVTTCLREHQRSFACEVRWPSRKGNVDVPPLIFEIEQMPGIIEVEWKALGSGPQ